MMGKGAGSRLVAILLSGLALGAVGLLEPLIRFWDHFHLLGMQWSSLILLYLGFGLVISIVAGAIVTGGLATRAVERRPVVFASYYLSGAFSLAIVLIAGPLIRHELLALLIRVSYGVIYPVLLIMGVIATVKLTPHLVQPILSSLIGYPSGRISRARLISLMVLIGLIIPLTAFMGTQGRRGFGGRAARTEFQSRPGRQPVQNLLLITIDALRADHLGTYGYDRPTSPVIDSLANESVVFESCFAQGNRTELSVASMFTSLYPSMHSVRDWKNMAKPLSEEVETLAEGLRDAGLRTAGLMANPHIKREWGLTQGFDEILEFRYGYLDLFPVRYLLKMGLLAPPDRVPPVAVPRAGVLVDEAAAWLSNLQGKPFFLYVHFMDVHHPCIPPRHYEALFRTSGATSTEAEELWKRNRSLFNMLPSEEELLPQADLLRFIDLYDGAIRYVDEEIGRLLKQLDQQDLLENTLVILTSDHGAEFLDHGDILHKSQFLYDELTHVPLIMRIPGAEGPRRLKQIVQHIDVMPTLQEIFDLPIGKSVQGQSLMPLLTDPQDWSAAAAFNQSYEFIAVRTPTHKLMLNLTNGQAYCFDLLEDPGEMNSICGEAAVCDTLESVLNEFLQKINVPPEGTRPRQRREPPDHI